MDGFALGTNIIRNLERFCQSQEDTGKIIRERKTRSGKETLILKEILTLRFKSDLYGLTLVNRLSNDVAPAII